MEIGFKASFLRQFKKLPKDLQSEAKEKLVLFKDPKNHRQLKVHKLKGELSGLLSFSINYRYRVVFEWERQNESVVFLEIGDHKIYN